MKQFKRTISVVLALLVILGAFTALPVSAAQIDESENQSTGSSSDEGVVFITSEAELRGFADRVNSGDSMKNKTVYLYAPITLTGEWTPIGTEEHPFEGTFDAECYPIDNLSIHTDSDYCGFFGYNRGTVLNLIVRNVAIEGKQYVGSIAGYSKWGTLQCCVNEGGTVSGENYVGGLVGEGSGSIYNCYNKCTVSATGDNVGGIIGSLGAVMNNVANYASVTGRNRVGGLAGQTAPMSYNSITSSFSDGGGVTITGNDQVGGIVGYNDPSWLVIWYCANSSVVRGNYSVGGIIGDARKGPGYCINYGYIEGKGKVGGIVGNAENCGIGMCANRKKVTASGALTGGIVGNITNGGVGDCYDVAIVYGNERVGGIAGGAENSTIEHCFVKAPETNGSKYGIDCERDNSVSDGRTGGLTGTSNGTGFDRCFWYSSCAERGIGDVSSSGRHSGSDYDYYYYQVRFKNKDNFPDWDFDNIWFIDENAGYPRLYFENKMNSDNIGVKNSPFVGDGSALNPYRIAFQSDWNDLADYVAQGKSNEFTYYRQECNIEINRMVGSSSAPFSGRYDGDGYTLTFNTTTSDATGCAPFKVASTAVIQHVRTAGSIVANHKFASGLVAFGYNTLEITDCYSGIAIESNVEDDATHGGFVAVTGDDSNVKIEGCVFGGEMLGPASGGCGGIVGYARNNLTIKNCLFAPSGYFLGSETIASEPFVRIRYSDRVWPDNNYSTILFFPSEQAGELFEITADSALDIRLRDYTEYKTSKVKVSPAGIDYDSHIYAAEGQGVPLYLHWRGSSASDTAYLTPSAGTLSGSNDNYTLTMPNEEVNIRLASEKVPYVDAAGNAQGSIGARILSGDATERNGGWCAVKENTTIDSRVTVTGDVNLILCDGAELTVPKGVNVAAGNSLTIWQQQGKTGKLTATSPETHYAAIGGGDNEDTGPITIHGGVLNLKATFDAAGIGGGYGGSAGNITINGGDITARGGGLSAAIGSGGGFGAGGTVTINGGKVTAIGGSGGAGGASGIGTSHRSGKLYPNRTITVNINGGDVTATGGNFAAGIGGGSYRFCDIAINITGGTINATGGIQGAGIGGGVQGTGGTINISGGTITAKGGSNNDGSGAGIGGGSTSAGGNVTILGSTVTATPGSGSDTQAIGHGSGAEDSGTLTLGNNNVRIKVGTVSGNNVTYVGASQRISTAQGTAAVRAAVCDSHQYEQGACKWCGIDAPTCIVTWKNDDGTVLKTDTVKISVVPTYTGATPTKAKTAQYTYTFDGWTPAIKAVTGDATYTAKYKSTVNQYTMPDRLFLLIRQRKLFPKREEPRGKGR